MTSFLAFRASVVGAVGGGGNKGGVAEGEPEVVAAKARVIESGKETPFLLSPGNVTATELTVIQPEVGGEIVL